MAGRIRSIKPEWLDDERMVTASSDARVLSIALILSADDYGNGRCHRISMAGRVFPPSGESPEELVKSYERFSGALQELVQMRFCGLYEVAGQHYFSIRKWKEHQKVSHPGKPLVPGPPSTLWSVSGDFPEGLVPDLDLINDQRPTTDDRDRAESAADLELSELQRVCREASDDEHSTAHHRVHERPELVEANRAWCSSLGLTARPLRLFAVDSRTRALVDLFASGYKPADVARMAQAAKTDAWVRGDGSEPPKGLQCLTPTVAARLLDALEHSERKAKAKAERKAQELAAEREARSEVRQFRIQRKLQSLTEVLQGAPVEHPAPRRPKTAEELDAALELAAGGGASP